MRRLTLGYLLLNLCARARTASPKMPARLREKASATPNSKGAKKVLTKEMNDHSSNY